MMNGIYKTARKIALAGSAVFTLLFGVFSLPVLAFGSNWESSNLYQSLGYMQGAQPSYITSSSNKYYSIGATYGQNSSQYPTVGTVGVIAYTMYSFKERNDYPITNVYILSYSLDSGWYLVGSYSGNNISWTNSQQLAMSNTFTGNNQNGAGSLVYYAYKQFGTLVSFVANDNRKYIRDFSLYFPDIPLVYGVSDPKDIIGAISLDADPRTYPWMWSSSSGGIHFGDGQEVDASNSVVYSNVFTVMDLNSDNSISNEEVNYYNVTYDTNYDYSTINNGNDFDLYDFLYYVSLKLDAGENPAGDGSGQGSQNTPAGSISIGDIQQQQQQQQYQTIEENAVNVTITNENGVNQSNSQYFDQVINNNLGTSGSTFEQAIGTISGFTSIARSFAGLASVVLGFLPGWVLALLAVTFSLLFVMIVFRLIHLFL